VQSRLPERSLGAGAEAGDMAKGVFEHGFQENTAGALVQGGAVNRDI
jgi:hypothetical protein